MKKYYLLFLGIISSFSLLAQSKAISYQAVIMDPNQIEIPGQSIVGQPLSNGSVCLKFTILNADGSIDYEETQSTQTDEFGLVSLSIGYSTSTNSQSKRTVLSTGKHNDFSAMKWDANRKTLKVSVSFDNCSSYKVSSIELLNYTPYAMYAGAVDYKNVDGAPTNLSQFNNDAGFIIPKDLDPLKKDIIQNQNNITNLSDKTDSKFLIVNQQIAVLDSSNKNTKTKIAAIDTTLAGYNTRLTSNETNIKQTNTYINQQVGGLQTQINTTNTNINQLGETYEVVSNKSDATNLGAGAPSNTLYPTQLAVKTYVDQTVQDAVASGAPDATTLAKGKVRLAGDLGGTADSPTVPSLANKESLSNKSTSISTDGGSNTKYPSAKAVKDYVDASVSGVAFQTNLDAKADKESPTFTGTPVLPTGTTAVTQSNTDNSTKLATTAFVQNLVSGVSGKEDVSNKSDNTSLGNSTSLYPTQNAVKVYVDNQVASATIADATNLVKGKIQLTGDLGGTAASPTVPGLANKENTIAAGTSIQYFRGDKTWQTLDKSAVGLGNVDNTSDASKPISSATQTALNLKEDASNKSDNTSLGSSTSLYPTQNAVKTYVDNQVASATIADATNLVKGKIQLTGDLGGTAASPTVPGLANKENTITAGTTAQYYRGDKSWQTLDKSAVGLGNVDNTSDAGKPISTATQTALDLKAPLASAALTGTPTAPTATAGTNTTQIATTAFVTSALTSVIVSDATTTGKGIIKLAGDLGGTGTDANAPVISNDAITTGKIKDGEIVNADISNSAAIADSKLATISTSGKVSNSATTATPLNTASAIVSRDVNGDFIAGNITAGSVNGIVPTAATVGYTIAGGTTSKTLTVSDDATVSGTNTGDQTITLTGDVTGTGTGSFATTIGASKVTNSMLAGNIDLTTKMTGVLPASNGGSGASTLTGYVKGNGTSAMTASAAIPVADVTGAAPSASPALTGTPTAPTATAGTNTTQIATTEFVTNAVSSGVASGITIGSIESSSTAKGATITSGVIKLAPADGTNPGIVTIGTQTFAGAKTFSSDLIANDLTVGKGSNNKSQNTALGRSALAVATGNYNTAIGYESLKSDISGMNNTAVGNQSLTANTTGNYNVAIGSNAMASNTTGGQNTAVGIEAMQSNTTSNGNTAMGRQSLNGTTTGNYNAGFGLDALATNTTGTRNTALGQGADVSASNLTNATAIGNTAVVNASNKIQLGNSSVTSVSTYGKLTTGSITFPNTDGTNGQVLSTDGSGTISWSTPSSGGVTAIGSVAGSSTANGASISSSTLSLAPADGTNPGIVTTGTQTFEGDKTFKSNIVGKSIFKVGSGLDSPNAFGGFTSGSNAYPSSPIIGIYGPMASATESTLLRLKLPLNYGSSIQSLADFVMSGGNKSKLTIKLGNQNDDDFVNALTLMNAASGSNPLVGINNTSPSSTLDVTGTSAVSGNATFGGTVGITGDITNSSLTASKAVFTDANKKLVSTGTLGLEQGGLGVSSIPAGQVVFGNSSSAVGTSGNLSFDSSNKILKVGPGVTLGNAEDGFTGGSASYSTTPILGVYGPASTSSETTLLRLKRTHNQGTSYQAVADFVMEGGNKSKLTLKLGNESDDNFINALTMVGAPSSTLPLIGINNTSPAKTLDITGTLGVSGASTFAGDLTITSGSPGLGKVLTSDANGLVSWSTPSSGGVTTIGSVAGSSTANGASISSSTLSLAPADGTNPGIVTTGTQTFAGTKTFSSTITGDISGNAGTVTNGVYTTNKISALAATTSTELAGVISDETGTGSLVLSASPALSGTPTAPTAAAGTSTTQLATTAFVQAAIREVSDEISVTSDGQTSFTLTQTKRSASTLKMYINGIRISNSAYSVSGTTVTYVPANNGGKTTLTTDRVQFDYSY